MVDAKLHKEEQEIAGIGEILANGEQRKSLKAAKRSASKESNSAAGQKDEEFLRG